MTVIGRAIRRTIIVGGGTAGWMTAAALSRAFGRTQEIILVESDRIGTVGVGEASVPSLREFNAFLGIDENMFVAETMGTFKLGIEFVGWSGARERYFHPFGYFGPAIDGIGFHHFLLRQKSDFADFSPETLAARSGRFGRRVAAGAINYAFQFDAARYAAFLRRYAEDRGVVRHEGDVVDVHRHGEDGSIARITLSDGHSLDGDLFIDCSGFRGLLIEGALGTGYTDWTHWLPCDRAVAMPCARAGDPVPYTRSTAREAGWQWRIPLQHRTGNGYVYSSAFLGNDDAARLLESRLDGVRLADPNFLSFTTGHRKAFWTSNCIAIGLAAGFLEPLESTSIHLIQTAIVRLLSLFPKTGIEPCMVDRYNRDTQHEYEGIRDFVLAHYALSSGIDTPFWQAVRNTPPPDSLQTRLDAYRATGSIFYETIDLFGPTNWYAILTGQNVVAQNYHPVADVMTSAALEAKLDVHRRRAGIISGALPPHIDYLMKNCPAPAIAADQTPFSSATRS